MEGNTQWNRKQEDSILPILQFQLVFSLLSNQTNYQEEESSHLAITMWA